MKQLFLSAILALLPFAAAEQEATPALPDKPGVVLLFYTDDVGIYDTSAYGCDKVPCPNLDKLAKEGLRFSDAHSVASVCTPSRFSLLTGKYAWRQNNTNILPGDAKLIIPSKDKFMNLASMMQKAGYKTGAFGKWHLGLGGGNEPLDWNKPISPSPREVGFDYSFIMAATGDRVPCVYVENGTVANLDPADPIEVSYKAPFPGEIMGRDHPELLKDWAHSADNSHNNTIIDGIPRIGHMRGGKAALWKDQDISDDITAAALRFIKENRGEPLFLYFCTNDIHVPRDPHSRFRGKSQLGIRGDATVQMDDALGKLITCLKEEGRLNDALIIYSSDNGPVISDGYKDGADVDCKGHNPAHPHRGGKYSALEGGTRIPFIVWWPRKVPAGTSDALISQMDLGRSLASLVGVVVPRNSMIDAEDHLPALLGRDPVGRNILVEQATSQPKLSLRAGRWKLIPLPDKPQLYDLSQDPAEQNNLAEERPEIVSRMKAKLEQIKAEGE